MLIVLNAVITFYIIRDEVNTETHQKEEKSKELIMEIKGLLHLIDMNLVNLDEFYKLRQKQLLSKIENLPLSKSDNQDKINQDLKNILSDEPNSDIYFIKNGKIIFTTDTLLPDINLYALLGKTDSIYFRNSIEKGQPFETRFIYNKQNNRFFATCFYPISGNRIVGIKSASDEFDKTIETFQARLIELAKGNEAVLSVNFWYHLDNQIIPLVNDDYTSLLLSEISKVPEDSLVYNLKMNVPGKKFGLTHIIEKSRKKVYNFKGISISILTDFERESEANLNLIKRRVVLLLVSLFVLFMVIYFATRDLKLTLADLLYKTSIIGKGKLHERASIIGNNEFTTLAERFNQMVEKVENAHKELLAKNEEISAQRDEIEAQRNTAIEQKNTIEKQKKDILDSIRYAKRIQEAVLPETNYFHKVLPKSFVLYKPCSLVSGDFYWIHREKDELIVIAADCTGHGVPGAFMSMLGMSLLNELVIKEKILVPSEILNKLREKVIYSLKQKGSDDEPSDGIEITVCNINKKEGKMQFAGAMNPLILIRDGQITEIEADYMPVGIFIVDKGNFTNHELSVQKNDLFYMSSDGFADQMGGPGNKRFKTANFKNLLLSVHQNSMEDQLKQIEEAFENWKGNYRQMDDVLVIGFRI